MRKRALFPFILFSAFLACFFCCAEESTDRIGEIMNGMTLREKVCQMILVTPEDLSGEERTLTFSPDRMSGFISDPFGGICIRGRNIASQEQILALNNAYASLSPAPFVITCEEGGTAGMVTGRLEKELWPSASALGRNDYYRFAVKMAGYLKDLGFTMNLSPMCDLAFSLTSRETQERCVSKDAGVAAAYAVQSIQGFRKCGVISVIKHFPGIGRADTPTHESLVTIDTPVKKLYENDLMPFRLAITSGAECVLVSEAVYSALDAEKPACLSETVIEKLLRDELGFDGIVMTDTLKSNALMEKYSEKEIAVTAVLAGADLLLLPAHPGKAADDIVQAVREGKMDEDRIDRSVEKILTLKLKYGILQ